jgi:hypothetical protein
MKLDNMCIRYAQGAVGFGTELLIQFSPPLTPSAIGKMMPPPLTASSASSIGQLKREKARSCTVRILASASKKDIANGW